MRDYMYMSWDSSGMVHMHVDAVVSALKSVYVCVYMYVCVCTLGVACGLPGQENVFEADNLARLLAGKSCVAPLSAANKQALLEKNVVQV